MPAPVHPGQEPQSARAVLMVRPASFGFNPQTAGSNAFQQRPLTPAHIEAQGLALEEFDGLARALQRAGVEVLIAPDTSQPAKPDAIFPNNWVTFHFDGTVTLYPMLAPNRRWERREDILEQVVREGGFHVSRTVDLSHREAEGKFLEGTGSLVLDRAHRVAYASLSPRTDLDVLGEFAQLLDYELVTFEGRDGAGQPVYHTNVIMAIGTRFAVVCGEAIAHPRHREAVFNKLEAAGHDVVDISLPQMQEFAGNLLELESAGGRVIALSTTGWRSLGAAQRQILESHAEPVPVSIPTIERIGGGGVRCMLAELHLPKRR
ncbi:MAG TPA: arginine deiminase-related protein [Steroidobacteraceae bacterium]|nr:arginine deiminase-related protein [Steroidobacteraceae bacterium]